MNFEDGELLLVPFPFSDLSSSKRRPVLVLTRPDRHGDFICLPVTSRPQPEFGVPLSTADLASGALPVASWIRTDRIVTLNLSLVVKSIARVRPAVFAAALADVCAYVGCRA